MARRLFPYAALTLITLPILVLYSWLLLSSFAERTEGLRPYGMTVANWRFLVEPISARGTVWTATFNSLVFAVLVALLEVSVAAMTGYALSRLSFPGRRGFLGLTLVLHAFPSVTLLIAIFLVLRFLGLYNNIFGVMLVKVALELPFGVWVMKGFFDGVPWDTEIAALVDGCSRVSAWWRVMVPLVKPGLAALAIFSFLSGWSEFLLPYLFAPSLENQTLSVLMYALIGDFRMVDYGLLTAVGLFYVVPVIFFYLFTQRYLMNIYVGGVKG